MNVHFFVEDKAHQKFLIDFVEERFRVSLNSNHFYRLESWSGYKKGGIAFPDYEQNTANEINNVTFLDADTDLEARKSKVIADFENLNINSALFLFPNNNDNGEIEIALAKIATQTKIIECFESYEECILDYEKPVNKSKILAYLDALLPASLKKNNKKDLIQEDKRDYRNTTHWNLYHEYLESLHLFLQIYFH